jgi:hypothetical protein
MVKQQQQQQLGFTYSYNMPFASVLTICTFAYKFHASQLRSHVRERDPFEWGLRDSDLWVGRESQKSVKVAIESEGVLNGS